MNILKQNMVKLQFDSNKQFKITLPKQICLAKGWKRGDEIKIKIDESANIVLIRTPNKK
jgi:bifunctional DNA-binding transcriptional regulator/antitoxin component of YhaV-PrlF toxin-antitoxin module